MGRRRATAQMEEDGGTLFISVNLGSLESHTRENEDLHLSVELPKPRQVAVLQDAGTAKGVPAVVTAMTTAPLLSSADNSVEFAAGLAVKAIRPSGAEDFGSTNPFGSSSGSSRASEASDGGLPLRAFEGSSGADFGSLPTGVGLPGKAFCTADDLSNPFSVIDTSGSKVAGHQRPGSAGSIARPSSADRPAKKLGIPTAPGPLARSGQAEASRPGWRSFGADVSEDIGADGCGGAVGDIHGRQTSAASAGSPWSG